jgi:transcriptional regulator with XRE-family HTH domain
MVSLREQRQKRFLSIRELATKAGVSTRTVQMAERGTPPRYATMRKLASALEVDPAEIDEFRDAVATWSERGASGDD